MFIETIRIENGKPAHLPYHQARFDRTRRHHYPKAAVIDLAAAITPPDIDGILKCRILYDREILKIDYTPYTPRPVRTLELVESDIDYAFKYADRAALDALFAQRGDADDILIVKNGRVTDTTIANIAFLKNGVWYTPDTPLLPGTTRARLLDEGRLTPVTVTPDVLDTFESFALLNAMIGFHPVIHGKIRY